MREHLPVLQVIVPLLSAPLVVALGRRGPARLLSLLAGWSTFAIAVTLLRQVLVDGPVSYAMGDWLAPWGIEYRIDLLGAFLLVLVSSVGAVVLTYAPASVKREIPEDRRYLFFAAYLLCLAGLLGIAITGDLFNLFVFLEISSLSSYALISLGPNRRALTASFQYLVMGTIGATFILIGIGLMYMMTGTLNMADMAERLAPVHQTRTVLAAFGFLTVGIGIKMALFPLHAWMPNAYTFAPSVVTAFLAATATKVSVYALIRVLFTIYGSQTLEVLRWDYVLLPLALIGIFVASTVAIFQRNIKRMLAYSSVAQIGYMALGISLSTETGLTGSIVHLFNHALTKGALFLAMGCFVLRLGSAQIDDLRGVGRTMPLTTFAWVLGGLSLIGVPLTAGFISKWYFIQAAVELGLWPVASLILVSSLLAVVYVWRVVEVAYFRAPPETLTAPGEAPLSMLIPTWALVGATLFFGVSTSWSAGIARQAARFLVEGLP